MPTAPRPAFKLELDVPLPLKDTAEVEKGKRKESPENISGEEVRNIIIPPGSPVDGNITGPTNAGTRFKVDVDTVLPP